MNHAGQDRYRFAIGAAFALAGRLYRRRGLSSAVEDR